VYGLKNSRHNWFEKLRSGLVDRGFIQSQVDKCVFFRDGCIILVYVDDCIIIGKSMTMVDSIIDSLWDGDEDFKLTDEGSLDKYIGVLVTDIDENSFEMSQPFLIRHIISFLSLDENKTRGQNIPVGKPLLNRDLDGILGSIPGCTVEQLECSAILRIPYDQRFKWQSIRLLASR